MPAIATVVTVRGQFTTMTHWPIAVTYIVLVLGLSPINGNIFQRTFNTLHQEPVWQVNQNRIEGVQTLWIEQKLDHFNATETRTWQMRYVQNDEFFKAGAPLFLYIGGEWVISESHVTGGHMFDMAKEHNGLLAYTEHRYYGQSKPLPDLSNENLKYLHVKQALADVAHFIRTQKATYEGLSDSKVIIVGGSYSAAMVTWLKREYPDLVTGGWASSAPLFAKVNFVEYKEITGQSIRLMGGEACYKRIENGISELERLFTSKSGAEVKALLKICEKFDVDNDLDIWALFHAISDIFSGVVQTHEAGQIEGVCQTILAESNDLIGLSKFLVNEFGKSGNKCNDLSYKAMLETIMDTRYTADVRRQWLYQACNEFGWYQTSGSQAQPFGNKFPITLYTTMCADTYGSQFSNSFMERQAAKTNAYFGGLQPEVENIYYTHGQLDPWRAVGIQNETLATIIPEHAHCSDLGSISENDTKELRASKETIAELVRKWLK